MKILIDKAQRLWKLPQPALGPMNFAQKRLSSRGVSLIDLGSVVSEPFADLKSLISGRDDPRSDFQILSDLKKSIAENHLPLSGVDLNPEKNIVITPGIDMTASLLALSILNPDDSAAYPDPGPQFFRAAICLADAVPNPYSLLERNDFLPNIQALTEPPPKKLRLIFLNYPHNPSTSIVDSYFYRDLLKAINFENILVVSDCALVHPGDRDAVSILQAKGAGKKAVELHSFGSSFGIDGLGFAAGHPDVIQILKSLLDALGYFPGRYRMLMAMEALKNPAATFEKKVESMADRRKRASAVLKELGWRIRDGKESPFIWVKPPARGSSLAFARRLVVKAGVRLAPGSDFGEGGEGWQRLSLHPDAKLFDEALERIAKHSRIWQRRYRPKT